MDSEQVADVLESAADVIERDGWYQGWYEEPNSQAINPPVCAVGAIGRALGEEMGFFTWHVAMYVSGHLGEAVHLWNDQGGRTEQEVLDVLRSTAKQVRMDGEATP